MKLLINISLLLSLALIQVGCASMDPSVSLSTEDVTRLMAVNDNLIVPGERIGPVFIGMTETELYKKMGDPSKTVRGSDGTWIGYTYNSVKLYVQVNPVTHKVNVIDNYEQDYFPYSTKEGITIGTSELRVQTLPWKLLWKRQDPYNHDCWTLQYLGIRIATCGGKVTGIDVHSPN